jgi:tetratricopeptide (TPR) repeat protein
MVGARAAWRRAGELSDTSATPHACLAEALLEDGDLEGAIAALRRAEEVDPRDPSVYRVGGVISRETKNLDRAVAAHLQAVQLDPRDADSYGLLGAALLDQGQFQEAEKALRRCVSLLPKGSHRQRKAAEQGLKMCQVVIGVDARLPSLLEGHILPGNNTERVNLAWLCLRPRKQRYALSARLFTEAFREDARLAGDLKGRYRYSAACAAALAGGGQGVDAVRLEQKERLALRRQALTWLHADLAAWRRLLEGREKKARAEVRRTLSLWQLDPDLASVRGQALEKLPTGEREAWRKFWAEVSALQRPLREP